MKFTRIYDTADGRRVGLHERIVAGLDRLPTVKRPRAGPAKNGFGDQRAGEHAAKLQAHDRDDGSERVAQRVF